MKSRQKGLTTVEFAIIGLLFLIVLFGVIEFGRLLFAWNTLTEATRRGARVAAVCPVNHASIARITVFNDQNTDGDSPVLAGLTTDMIQVQYLDQNGAQIDPVTNFNFDQIRYVRVNISGYTHQLYIPLFTPTLTGPPFETTLPRESLGFVPNPDNPPASQTQCFGVS